MDVVLEFKTLREELVREINEKIEQVIDKLEHKNQISPRQEQKYVQAKSYESVYPLNVRGHI